MLKLIGGGGEQAIGVGDRRSLTRAQHQERGQSGPVHGAQLPLLPVAQTAISPSSGDPNSKRSMLIRRVLVPTRISPKKSVPKSLTAIECPAIRAVGCCWIFFQARRPTTVAYIGSLQSSEDGAGGCAARVRIPVAVAENAVGGAGGGGGADSMSSGS